MISRHLRPDEAFGVYWTKSLTAFSRNLMHSHFSLFSPFVLTQEPQKHTKKNYAIPMTIKGATRPIDSTTFLITQTFLCVLNV